MSDLGRLQDRLGVRFKDLGLLKLALVHSSHVNECDTGMASNERLEFLGDAVLGLALGEALYRQFPDLDEGGLTQKRARLACQSSLAQAARAVGLGEQLCLGRGEEASGGREKPANLASALEAVIAAVYLDRGLEEAERMIQTLFAAELSEKSAGPARDSKSALQELIQARLQVTPVYSTTVIPGAVPRFHSEVMAGGTVLGRGEGGSKKEAETEAAKNAMEHTKTLRQSALFDRLQA